MIRILTADDEAVILLQLEDALTAMGFEVVAMATNGAQAVELAHKNSPDVALLDIVMPGNTNGIDACRILQDELSIPVVLISANSDATHLAQVSQVKPAGYIVKPFQPEQVAATLRLAALNGAHCRRASLPPQQDHHNDQDKLLSVILESASLGAAICDTQGTVTFLNQRLKNLGELILANNTMREDLPGTSYLAASDTRNPQTELISVGLPRGREAEVMRTSLPEGGSLVTYTDVTDLRHAENSLAELKRVLDAKSRIIDAFMIHGEVDLFSRVSATLTECFGCTLAFFGYLNPKGDLIIPSRTGDIWKRGNSSHKNFTFPPKAWGGAWGKCLIEHATVLHNTGLKPPPGHIALDNALAVPILQGPRLLGQFLLANKAGGFTEADVQAVEAVATYCAPTLQARLEGLAIEKERQESSAVLMRSEQRYRQIVETSLEGIWTINAGGLTTYANKNLAEMLGHTPQSMLGRHYFEFIDQATIRETEQRLEKCRQGFSAQYDFRFKGASGASVWVICSTSPLMEPGGNFYGVLIMTSNITYRKLAEHSLMESEERFRQLVENLSEVFWIREFDSGQPLYVSPSYEKVWGQTVGKFMSKPLAFLDSVYHKDRDHILREQQQFNKNHTPMSCEYRIMRPDGELRWVHTSAYAVLNDSGKPYRTIGISEDITERKHAAQERDRLAQAIEQVDEIVIITDPHGTIQYANPAFARISGQALHTVIGCNIAVLESTLDDEVYLSELCRALSDGVPWKGRYRYTQPDGSRREVKATFSAIMDNEGRLANYVSVQRDVTEAMHLESQLNQARKMEALGTLAGGIAHDFNNILMAILGFGELAMADAPQESKQRNHLDRVMQAGHRARDLVRQILAFSRRAELERTALKPGPLVAEALKLLRATLPANVNFQIDIAPTAGEVLADPGQIHQIVMNLCTNAAYALECTGGGTIAVRLAQRTVAPGKNIKKNGTAPNQFIVLEVSDDGPGMPASVLNRVFDPFFTTKARGEGTGMGLSVVHGTVHALGGTIDATSALGQGTCFTVRLPLLPATPPTETLAEKPSTCGTERILFVDDEQTLVDLARECLSGLGYSVTALTAPGHALELFRNQPDDYDILVTDQAMPGTTGLELAREVHTLRPQFPVILCTGFSHTTTTENLREQGVAKLLHKPFSFESLSQALRTVLDSRPD